jgi:hypothetical protein
MLSALVVVDLPKTFALLGRVERINVSVIFSAAILSCVSGTSRSKPFKLRSCAVAVFFEWDRAAEALRGRARFVFFFL